MFKLQQMFKDEHGNVLGDGEVGVGLLGLSSGAVLQRLQQGEEARAARRLRRRHHYYSPRLKAFKTERERERGVRGEAMLETREEM